MADEISSIDFLYAQVFFKQKDYAKAKEYAQRAAQKNNPGTFIYQQSQNFISVINEKLK
jgi:TPR repeat protein